MITLDAIESLTPFQLSRMLTLDPAPRREADCPGILQHALHSPLLQCLAEEVPDMLHLVRHLPMGIVARKAIDKVTFLDELTSPSPRLQALKAIKWYARTTRDDSSSPLSGKPATVLYYAAIAAALVGCGTRISRLCDRELRGGFDFAARQAGAEALRPLFREAALQLDTQLLERNRHA